MTRKQALAYSIYTETGNGISKKMTLVFKPKAFQYLINTIYDSLEQRIAELESPRTCEGCAYNRFGCNSLGHAVDCTLELYACSRVCNDYYEPKKDTE